MDYFLLAESIAEDTWKYAAPAMLAGVLAWIGKEFSKLMERLRTTLDKVDLRLGEMSDDHLTKISEVKKTVEDSAKENRHAFANSMTALFFALHAKGIHLTEEDVTKVRDALNKKTEVVSKEPQL